MIINKYILKNNTIYTIYMSFADKCVPIKCG